MKDLGGMRRFNRLEISKSSNELKRLIAENPDLPIMVLCDNDLYCDYYSSAIAPCISFYLGEFLDCYQEVNEERVYFDRDEFLEELSYKLEDLPEFEDLTQEEFDKAVEAEFDKYSSYWQKAIIINAST